MGAAIFGFGLQRSVDQLGYVLVGDGTRPSWAQLVMQSFDAPLQEASAPFANGGLRDAECCSDLLIGHAIIGHQYNANSPHQPAWQ